MCSARLSVGPSAFSCISMTFIDPQIRCVLFILLTIRFASDSDINNVHATVNTELVGGDNRVKAKRLSFKVGKTSYMIISNQKTAIDIKIWYSVLTKVWTVKFLTFKLNENLNFLKNISTKISKSVGVMISLHCQLPADVMVKLYYSLVYSHLTYTLLAWGWSAGKY